MSEAIAQQIKEALAAKDASKLDLAMRAQHHYVNRGTSVDTTEMEFGLVKSLDPKFYG